MEEIITSDDILGKDVVDTDGDILGVVQQLKIDKKAKKILGILVDQGFMKPDLYISLDLVRNFGVDSVFLDKSPNPKIKGLDVYDADGKKLGYVFDIEEDNKKDITLSARLIKKSKFGKAHKIKAKDIKTIGYNILLRHKESALDMEPVKYSGITGDII